MFAEGREPAISIECQAAVPLDISQSGDDSITALNIDLHDDGSRGRNLAEYYGLCSPGLHVTTSCFTIWRKNKKTNGFAKVIPAIPAASSSDDPVRVFFFDDNLEWEGLEKSPGICNLRDVSSGKFVQFNYGSNGFFREYAGKHTVIHVSNEYQNVLVKANILDAMEDSEYFSRIIRRFTQSGERVVVFMDVNSTIVCNDSVQGKDTSATLLSTMFEFIEVKLRAPTEFTWEAFPVVTIKNSMTLKTIVKELTVDDKEAYSSFFSLPNCTSFFEEVVKLGDVVWTAEGRPLSWDDVMHSYRQYSRAIANDISPDGITASWFTVFESLASRDPSSVIVLNSFGVDTRKVILATLPDERGVMQITVNWDLWDKRDMQKFKQQFEKQGYSSLSEKQPSQIIPPLPAVPTHPKETPVVCEKAATVAAKVDNNPPAAQSPSLGSHAEDSAAARLLACLFSCLSGICGPRRRD